MNGKIKKQLIPGLSMAGITLLVQYITGDEISTLIALTGCCTTYGAYHIGHFHGWSLGHAKGFMRAMDDLNQRGRKNWMSGKQ